MHNLQIMSKIRHEWLTTYFDKRPQIQRPEENVFGFDIPYPWKCVVEKLLLDKHITARDKTTQAKLEAEIERLKDEISELVNKNESY